MVSENAEYFKVNDIMLMLGCSKGKAYEIIRNLNAELQKQGYMVRRGYISANYFRRRYAL